MAGVSAKNFDSPDETRTMPEAPATGAGRSDGLASSTVRPRGAGVFPGVWLAWGRAVAIHREAGAWRKGF